MPGPMVPRPAPTPSAIGLPTLPAAITCVIAVNKVILLRSMRLGDGAAEVDGSESGEDECLEAGDQDDLEDEEDDGDREREHAQRRKPEQHDHAAAHEEDQQVSGEQVREQSDGQRDDPDEMRNHLDDEQERL